MACNWNESPDPESVERAMRRRATVDALLDSRPACPHCAQRARIAEEYRRKWQDAECRLEQEQERGGGWAFVLVCFLALYGACSIALAVFARLHP